MHMDVKIEDEAMKVIAILVQVIGFFILSM